MQSANRQNKVSQNIIDHSYYIFMPFTLMHLTGTPDFIFVSLWISIQICKTIFNHLSTGLKWILNFNQEVTLVETYWHLQCYGIYHTHCNGTSLILIVNHTENDIPLRSNGMTCFSVRFNVNNYSSSILISPYKK